MVRLIVHIAIGFSAGLIIATFAMREPDPGAPIDYPSPAATVVDHSSVPAVSDTSSDEMLAALRADMELRLRALDQRLDELASEMETLGATSRRAGGHLEPPMAPPPPEETSTRFAEIRDAARTRSSQRVAEQLLAAGFTPERIEWINRRSEELKTEAMRAQYEVQRTGRPPDSDALLRIRMPESGLRAELGDGEYERYLNALGQPTSVRVNRVLASSPAEQAGLQAGDEIVAYGGRRVFSMAEVNAFSLEGEPGEPVVVEVMRNGQVMQLVLPRGPLGVPVDVVDLMATRP